MQKKSLNDPSCGEYMPILLMNSLQINVIICDTLNNSFGSKKNAARIYARQK